MAFAPTRGLRYAELFAVGDELITVYNSMGLSEAPGRSYGTRSTRGRGATARASATVIKNGPHWWASDRARCASALEVDLGRRGSAFALPPSCRRS